MLCFQVRNLCYMVSRREKLSRMLFRLREQTFHRQVSVLTQPSYTLSSTELTAVKEANHGPSIYDRLYSHVNAPELSTDFDTVVARIEGIASPTPEDKGKLELNGLVKSRKTENPYKKMYLNGGSVRRRSIYGSMSSGSETDNKHRLRVDLDSAISSTEDRKPPSIISPASKKNSVLNKEKKLSKKRTKLHTSVESSSEEDNNVKRRSLRDKWESPRSKSLRQMERELTDKSGQTDDSDEIMTLKPSTKKDSHKMSGIYSDSDSEASLQDDDTVPSDSQQLVLRTKAAMKEFSAGSSQHDKGKRTRKASLRSSKSGLKEIEKGESSTEEYKKDEDHLKMTKRKSSKESTPSEMIVPQRQAAKKATESMRGSQIKMKQDNSVENTSPPKEVPQNDEPKIKQNKSKNNKEVKLVSSRETKLPNDIYEFERDSIENSDILAYVPQRQAAKKAAEHLKSGKVTVGQKQPQATESEFENKSKTNEVIKNKKEIESIKSKKEFENDKTVKSQLTRSKSPEKKTRRVSKSVSTSSSTSSTSSGSGSSSSSSESEDNATKSIIADKKSLFDPLPQSKGQRRSSQDKKVTLLQKKDCSKKLDTPLLDKSRQSTESTSSSSIVSESENESPLRKKVSSPRKSLPSIQQKNRDESSIGAAVKKFRKTPDKKLKTSDGRPEFQLQQPPTERKESTRHENIEVRKSRSRSSDRFGQLETRYGDKNTSVTDDNIRCRSNTPQCDRKPSVEKPSKSPQKKDEIKPSRRERKCSDSTESIWGKGDAADECSKKYKTKSQYLTVKGRKINKKKNNEEKVQIETVDDTLDKVKEPNLNRSQHRSSKSSISRKPVENTVKKHFFKNEQENMFVDGNILSSPTVTPNKSTLSDKYINADRGLLPKPQTTPHEITSKGNCDDSSDRSISSTESEDTSVDIVESSKEDGSKNSSDLIKSNNNMEVDDYVDSCKPHPNNKINEIDELDYNIPKTPVVLSQNHEQFKSGTLCEDFIKQDPDHIMEHISISHIEVDVEDVKEERLQDKRNSKSEICSQDLEITKSNNIFNIDLSSKQTHFTNSLEKERHELQVSDFHVETECEPKKINSRTSSLSASGYQQRSIFSPQQPNKDAGVADLFDFGNDMLAVDETVNDDGFGLPRNSDEILRSQPLTFSFGNEFSIFKEDSKEDSARETLNLVEKLRLEYAKKTNTQSDISEPMTPGSEFPQSHQEYTEEPKEELVPAPLTPVLSLENNETLKSTELECSLNAMKATVNQQNNDEMSMEHKNEIEEDANKKHGIPPYQQTNRYSYQHCGREMDIEKVPGRENIDRSNSAQADERWVPPSSLHYEPIPSPYTEVHGINKWAGIEVLPSRRSSSSSVSSTSSSSIHENVDRGKREDFELPPPTPNLLPELPALQFTGLHAMPYGACTLPDGQPYLPYSEASQFVPSVSLFSSSQMPFPSSGLYPPPFAGPYPGPHGIMSKVPDDTLHITPTPCTAAFTSSSHNMALTAAMVSPNPQPSVHEPPLTPAPFSDVCRQLQHSESPIQKTEPYNHAPPISQAEKNPTPLPPPPPPAQKLAVGKKSPAKPTRSSARVIQQQKSPAKSPGISPRQSDPSKTPSRGRETGTKRGRGSRGGGSSRGRSRGRGRGRGQMHTHYNHSDPNTIHSKLVGTVYDFDIDEDIDNSLENLRAMRERRRSTDVHERKSSDSSFLSRDSSSSPKFTSPHNSSRHRTNHTPGVRDLRPPTPVSEIPNQTVQERPSVEKTIESFPDVVQPMLPGPVDMRTYNSTCEQTGSNIYHSNLVGTFTTNPVVENQDYALDDLEHLGQLESDAANKSIEETRKDLDVPPTIDVQTDISSTTNKIVISDSRDQLKFKIKGPFSDANYISTVIPVSQPVMPPVAPDLSAMPLPTTAVNASGTSNLRRMRKKELLRQYWTQENMDEPTATVATGQIAPPIAAPPLNRAVITIPKAVASMTSIPTREDYKCYNATMDTSNEKRRRKEKPVNIVDNAEEPHERRNAGISNTPDSSHPVKRRGRQARNNTVTTPKLKIKIGGTSVEPSVTTTSNNEEKKNLRERPPKKRLSNVLMPSVEELRRESMKYRKMVMAGFDEEDKKKSKEVVSGRKKKKMFDVSQIKVIADGAPKLIIRFGKRSVDNKSEQTTVIPSESPPIAPPPSRTSECSELDKVRTSKITPIRLKLSRCEEGYVMKKPLETLPCGEETQTTASSLPISHDCVVR